MAYLRSFRAMREPALCVGKCETLKTKNPLEEGFSFWDLSACILDFRLFVRDVLAHDGVVFHDSIFSGCSRRFFVVV